MNALMLTKQRLQEEQDEAKRKEEEQARKDRQDYEVRFCREASHNVDS